MTTAKELITTMDRMALVVMNLRRGKFDPMWHAVREDGSHMVIGSDLDKANTEIAIRRMFQRERVVAYVFGAVSSVIEFPAGTSNEEVQRWIDLGEEARERHPNAQRRLVYMAEDEQGEVTAYRDLVPLWADRMLGATELGPLIWEEKITLAAGRFVGMLPRKGKPQ